MSQMWFKAGAVLLLQMNTTSPRKLFVTNYDSAAIMGSKSNNQGHWVHTWASMPMLADSDNLPPDDFVSMIP